MAGQQRSFSASCMLQLRPSLPAAIPDWAPLPVQFVDYAAWQRQHITRDLLASPPRPGGRRTCEGAPPLLELPWDHQRPEIAGYAGAAMPVQVSPAVTAQLQQLAAAEHTTLFCVVLAAVKVGSRCCFPHVLYASCCL